MTLCQAPISIGGLLLAGKRQLAGMTASNHVADAVSRGAAGAAQRARSPGCRVRHVVLGVPRSWPDREDDGRSRALRRRVTLIYGGYRGCPRQSTHDSASSGGRAVLSRELGRMVRIALLVR